MDTKLKKGKQIRAFLYRALAFGLLIATLLSFTKGYKAFIEFFIEQHYQIAYGDITGLTEFQEYIGQVYNKGMVAFSGVGDDRGYPLQDNGTDSIKEEATITFYDAIAQNPGDLLYYVYDHNYIIAEDEYSSQMHTNFPNPIFSSYDGHIIMPDDVILLFYQNGPEHALTSNGYINLDYTKFAYMPNAAKAQELDFVLAIKKTDFMTSSGPLAQMDKTATIYMKDIIRTGMLLGALIVSCFLCIASTKAGREVKRSWSGFSVKILLEIKLAVVIFVIISLWDYIRHPLTAIPSREYFLVCGLGMLLYPILIDIIANNGKLLNTCIPVFVYKTVQEWGEGEPWRKRLGIYSGISGVIALFTSILTFFFSSSLLNQIKKETGDGATLLSLFFKTEEASAAGMAQLTVIFWLIIITVILVGICLYNGFKFVQEVQYITDKISNIRNGKLREELPPINNRYMTDTIEDVNMLESGIENAVELKSRADRMQVELITNVSHDLKTPLTSIINYVDLLCEEDLNPAAKDYVRALRDKSYKLKSMVQDVFEVSKASTGNMNVEKTVLDLAKLIRQTLADMDERIEQSNLTFKVNLPDAPVYIQGDGEKLYRVFQNLFVNAIQYSLDYSRVHVALTVDAEYAMANIKNTSRGELSFDALEITERFVRADASRTTEGSGLGLSIAKSFANACGGEFEIITDADMFTATVKFPIVAAPVLEVEPPKEETEKE